MRVLVTGGAGYVGTELVHALLEGSNVERLTIYDNLSRRNLNLFISKTLPPPETRFVLGDILDTRLLRAEIEQADVVYHLAARVMTPFGHDDPHVYEQVNHWGTAELSYLLEAGTVRRVVYASSTSVYGTSSGPADRATVPNPSSHYGWSKLRGERTFEHLDAECEVYVARCGNVYGYSPSMRFDSVVNRFMFEAHFRNRITVNGSGQQKRPFLHVRNACRGLVAMGQGRVPAGIYNLVDRNTSILELARTVGGLYPGLETLYTDQDLKLRNLEVLPDRDLAARVGSLSAELADELDELRGRFAFTPRFPAQMTA